MLVSSNTVGCVRGAPLDELGHSYNVRGAVRAELAVRWSEGVGRSRYARILKQKLASGCGSWLNRAATGLTAQHRNSFRLPPTGTYVWKLPDEAPGTLGEIFAAEAPACHCRAKAPNIVGLFQGTMLPTRNVNYGRGRIVAPGTFVVDRGEEPSIKIPKYQ